MTFYRPDELAKYHRRIEKQREYQRNYRQKLAREKTPERTDIASAALQAVLDVMARRGNPAEVVGLALIALELKGFSRAKSQTVLREMLNRYTAAGVYLPPCPAPNARRGED